MFALNDFTLKSDCSLAPRDKSKLLKKCCHPCVSSKDELNDTKNEFELEPFTHYSCTGHIKNNNVPINRTTDIEFMIDCGMLIFTSPQCNDKNNELVSSDNYGEQNSSRCLVQCYRCLISSNRSYNNNRVKCNHDLH